MRPLFALGIFLLGLSAAFPEAKFGTTASPQVQDTQVQDAKFQDRIAVADDTASSSDVEITGSLGAPVIATAEIGDLHIVLPPIATPDANTLEIRKTDRELALLTPPGVEAAEAAHNQGETVSEPPAGVTTETDEQADANTADSIDHLCNALLASAQDNDLPVAFFANLIWQESRLQHDAVSPVGAQGIAQFMPEVAEEVGLDDPFDPRQAIPASARFLKVLRQHFGNLGYVAAAYNAGAGRVGAWLDRHRRLPRETRTYVLRVTGRSAEAWRKAPLKDSKLAFAPSLPCRTLPAFAELARAQQNDAKDARPQQEKIATRVSHLIARKVAARIAAKRVVKVAVNTVQPASNAGSVALPLVAEGTQAPKAVGPARSRLVKMKVAAKAVPQSTANAGSVALPVVAQTRPVAKPAAASVIARNVRNRRDALHRPLPVPHDKRRVAHINAAPADAGCSPGLSLARAG